MLFFRSGEDVEAWCRQRDLAIRPTITMSQLWYLADTWYGNRLTVDSRRPAAGEISQIFATVGLEGPFWDPFEDSWSTT
ncbi:MAG: hypothetical protein JSW55_03355 [Chloroflexota bacterium]|nr:MAG: hypothetical protein JSW55_03355 [Chloroflexota bacterium]